MARAVGYGCTPIFFPARSISLAMGCSSSGGRGYGFRRGSAQGWSVTTPETPISSSTCS